MRVSGLISIILCCISTQLFAATGDEKPLRLTAYMENQLRLGQNREFTMDGRSQYSEGVMTDNGDGSADFILYADQSYTPPFYLFPPFTFARIEIRAKDTVGSINFCTGEVTAFMDSSFNPIIFGIEMPHMDVVTDLTTGTAEGVLLTEQGQALDDMGDLTLAAVDTIEKFNNPLIDFILRLPTDVSTVMHNHLHFPEGRFDCPGESGNPLPDTIRMTVLPGSKLSIAKLPTFDYDEEGVSAFTTIDKIEGTVAHFYFPGESYQTPPLVIIPGKKTYGGIGVDISTVGIGGTVDICSGEINMLFDAAFTPYVFGKLSDTRLSVVTDLTTEISAGAFRSEAGSRIDANGNALIVGVAQVPVTEDPFINLILTLPSDAVTIMPMHFEINHRDDFCAQAGVAIES